MNWFYESAGQQQGPVPEHELDRLLAEGKITPDTLIWREGMGDWQPLRVARAEAATPPPPMPATSPTGDLPSGHVRCALTGKVIPESEAIYIQGKPYSAEAKPQVLQSLQSGSMLPTIDEANRTGPAWERRQELGFFAAAWETIKSILMQPSAEFSNMKREGGIGGPLAFSVIIGTIGSAVLYLAMFAASVMGALPQPEGMPVQQQQMSTVELFLQLLLAPVQIAIGAFIQSGITHVALMIIKGANRPFETTFRTLCYSSGALSALMVIPVCGWIAAAIYGLVLPCIGIARTHEISTGKAVLGVYLPALVCCGVILIIAAIASVVIPIMSRQALM